MKIQMIGHSRAGKTTYMADMYKVMMEEDGYQLRLRNRQDHKQLARLADKLEDGKYPPETAVKSQYNFKFKYEDEKLFSFEWMDYRGGVLDGMMDDREELKEIDKCVKSCESMIVFLDSTIMDCKEGEKQWNHLANFILKFSCRANKETPLSLTIILTKMDLLRKGGDPRKSKVGKKLMNTIQQLNSNKHLYGMLAFSSINEDTDGNTFYSVLNAMSVPLKKSIDKTTVKIEKAEEKLSRLPVSWWIRVLGDLGMLGFLKNLGIPVNGQKREEILDKLEDYEDTLESLQDHMKKMRKILKENAEDEDYFLFGKYVKKAA